jgi:hypothetical protein
VVSVKGTVGDQDVKRAKLIFNGNPMDISVNRGYFEQKVALVQEQNTGLVEAASADGGVSRSKLINNAMPSRRKSPPINWYCSRKSIPSVWWKKTALKKSV